MGKKWFLCREFGDRLEFSIKQTDVYAVDESIGECALEKQVHSGFPKFKHFTIDTKFYKHFKPTHQKDTASK